MLCYLTREFSDLQCKRIKIIFITHTATVVLLLPLLLAVLRCGYAIPTGTPALRYISLVRCDKRLLLRFDLELNETLSSLLASVSKEFLSVVVAEVGGGGGGSNGDKEDFRLVDGVGVVLALRDVEPDSLGLCLRLCLASRVKIRPSALTVPTLGLVDGDCLPYRTYNCDHYYAALTLAEEGREHCAALLLLVGGGGGFCFGGVMSLRCGPRFPKEP
uniref:Uncharacterized protein n=1 Tax=Glossina pallidipes TaxID=7398 RepID=A0A1B0AAN5_GLOPL